MSSPPKEEDRNLKGGHAPAEKMAGGVRIARKEKRPEEDAAKGAKDDDEGVQEETKPNPNDEQRRLVVSGVVAQGNKDFPEEAVKAFHEKKPIPKHQQQNIPNFKQPRQINQPGKR